MKKTEKLIDAMNLIEDGMMEAHIRKKHPSKGQLVKRYLGAAAIYAAAILVAAMIIPFITGGGVGPKPNPGVNPSVTDNPITLGSTEVQTDPPIIDPTVEVPEKLPPLVLNNRQPDGYTADPEISVKGFYRATATAYGCTYTMSLNSWGKYDINTPIEITVTLENSGRENVILQHPTQTNYLDNLQFYEDNFYSVDITPDGSSAEQKLMARYLKPGEKITYTVSFLPCTTRGGEYMTDTADPSKPWGIGSELVLYREDRYQTIKLFLEVSTPGVSNWWDVSETGVGRAEANIFGGIKYSLTLDKDHYKKGDTVNALVKLENTSNTKVIVYEGSMGSYLDNIGFFADGKYVKCDVGDIGYEATVVIARVVEPGESLEYNGKFKIISSENAKWELVAKRDIITAMGGQNYKVNMELTVEVPHGDNPSASDTNKYGNAVAVAEESGLRYTMYFDKDMYDADTPIIVTVTLENIGNKAVTLTHANSGNFLNIMDFYEGKYSAPCVFNVICDDSQYRYHEGEYEMEIKPGEIWVYSRTYDPYCPLEKDGVSTVNPNDKWEIRAERSITNDKVLKLSAEIPHKPLKNIPGVVASGVGYAEATGNGVKLSLSLDQDMYDGSKPIKATVSFENISGKRIFSCGASTSFYVDGKREYGYTESDHYMEPDWVKSENIYDAGYSGEYTIEYNPYNPPDPDPPASSGTVPANPDLKWELKATINFTRGNDIQTIELTVEIPH